VKQEDPLPYMLEPSIDQQQAEEQMSQEARVSLSSTTSDTQPSVAQPSRSSSYMTQNQAFANGSQQCERQTHNIKCCELTY
jgi:hypothetical protein